MTSEDAVERASLELLSARNKHRPMQSFHEGYAVILEELEELWGEVKKQSDERNQDKMRKEASHVAAMALRFMVDLL